MNQPVMELPDNRPTASTIDTRSNGGIRVIYVMGAGRSGSTALEAMLGDHDDVVAVGEISSIFTPVWEERSHCACGTRGPDCEVWQQILKRWQELTGQETFLQNGPLNAKFEALHRRFGVSAWLRQSKAATNPDEDAVTWLEHTKAIYQAIADVTGKRTIVDSSKSPLRARGLCVTPGLDMRLIHLIRDVRGVAWSRLKAYRKDPKNGFGKEHKPVPAWRSVGHWGLSNLWSSAVRHAHPECPSMLLRYEDFTARPLEAFARISDVVGIDYAEIAARLVAGEAVRPQHTAAGNPVRMKGAIRLSPDYQWVEKLPEKTRSNCWLLGGWLARRYGYEKHPVVPTTEAGELSQEVWDGRIIEPVDAESEASEEVCRAA